MGNGPVSPCANFAVNVLVRLSPVPRKQPMWPSWPCAWGMQAMMLTHLCSQGAWLQWTLNAIVETHWRSDDGHGDGGTLHDDVSESEKTSQIGDDVDDFATAHLECMHQYPWHLLVALAVG